MPVLTGPVFEPVSPGERAMMLSRLAAALPLLSFVATVLYVVLFLAGARVEEWRELLKSGGLWAGVAPLVLVAATYWVRRNVGRWLLERKAWEEALHYSEPRASVTLTTGREEAARNRFAAAEAARVLGDPERALKILQEEAPEPRNPGYQHLLMIARIRALLDLQRLEEAEPLWLRLEELPPHFASSSARKEVGAQIHRLRKK